MIVAFDPGKNIGVAFVNPYGRLVYRAIISLEELKTLVIPTGTTVIVGDGTGSRAVQEVLRARALSFAVVDETDTSLQARELYFRHHPPRGLRRLLPQGMRAPARPIDDYAAYALALRYLKLQPDSGGAA
jgi:RNase H-fold protein (predicted Holliday junction resolvase)